MSLLAIMTELIEAIKGPVRLKRNYKIIGNNCPKCGTTGALKRWWEPVVSNSPRKLGGYNCQFCHWDSRE